MPKKTIKGEDGKTYVVKTPSTKKWYKRWYTWTGVIVFMICVTGGIIAYHSHQEAEQASNVQAVYTSSSSSDSGSDDEDSSSDTNSTDSESDDPTLTLSDGTDVNVKKQQAFNPKYGDTSFRGSDLEVVDVTVATTESFTYTDDDDNETDAEGYIVVRYTYTAGTDSTMFDDQAVLNTSDGQQIDVDSQDSTDIDEINSGATKKGTLVFMVPNISKTNQFSSIRLKFDVNPDNSSDFHTYDMTMQLKAQNS